MQGFDEVRSWPLVSDACPLIPVSGLLQQFSQSQFWVAAAQIVWVNLILSGDNAVVIAMACRGLRPRQRRAGLILGAGVAVALRIVFTIIVSALMTLPYLRLVGACALIWIAIDLVRREESYELDAPQAAESLWRAVRIVAVADVIMSLDNAVAIAAVANGSPALLGLGIAISIPIVVGGSGIILALMERLPIIVWIGGAVLGWVAGELFVSDPIVRSRLPALMFEASAPIVGAARHFADQLGLSLADLFFGLLGAVFVVIAGLARRHAAADASDKQH